MVNVVLRVERGERERVEGGREVSRAHPLPEHTAPAEVVVGVEVAAAERRGRELQVPEDSADDGRADDEERRAAAKDRRQTPAPRAPPGDRHFFCGHAPAVYVLHDDSISRTGILRTFSCPELSQRK